MLTTVIRSMSVKPLRMRGYLMVVAVGLGLGVGAATMAQQNNLPINRPSSAFPKIQLGGVKSQAPRGIGTVRGSLLPPPPVPVVRPNAPAGSPTQRPVQIIQMPGDTVVGGNDRARSPDAFRDSTGRNTPGPGVTVDGRYSDDRFRIGFHIGSALRYRYGSFYGSPYGYPYRYFGGYGADSWYGDLRGQPIGGYVYPEPMSTTVLVPVYPPAPPVPLTDLEKADLALGESRMKDAVKYYQEHLKTRPNDAEATRMLAMALLLDKRHKEAVAVMMDVYEKHPGLAAQVIEPEKLPMGAASLRTLVLAVVPYANRTKTASGYLTTAVLLQAQGKSDAALRLLNKAKEAGLDEKVALELEHVLKP